MFEEDPFFSFGPYNVVGKGVDLDLLAAWDRVEEVEKGADYDLKRDRKSTRLNSSHSS